MREDFKTRIYAAIFWASLMVIAIWILLKMLGYIQSPVWVELIPYAGAIFALGAFFQIIYDMRKNLWKLDAGMRKIASEIIRLKVNADYTDKRVDRIEQKISN